MSKESRDVTITNRKAWHDYTIEDTYQAGIELVGVEVKSIRTGKVNLQDSFCRIEDGGVKVYGMYISPYEFANRAAVEPRRTRRLLLHKEEIRRMHQKADQKGLTIIPLKLYFVRGYAKLEIGIAKGKREFDKRDSIAERDVERERRRDESERHS
jgi:SsrA-binding protein